MPDEKNLEPLNCDLLLAFASNQLYPEIAVLR